MKAKERQVRYGNWVSGKLIAKVVALFAVFFSLTVLLHVTAPSWGGFGIFLEILLAVCVAFFLSCSIYFMAARRLFSYEGGGVQNKILELLLSHIRWDGQGKALDIGCGSGALAVKLAKRFEAAHITGVDYWGGAWGYAKKQCEANAAAEGVGPRITFQQASASRLPFADESFDLAVSNLTFHEVKDGKNKIDVLKEALRVVKKGGCFVFQDLFLIKQYYGEIDELMAALKAMGVREVEFIDTSRTPCISGLLKLPFMVGTIGLLRGIR